jgi:stress response protein YsnF
LDYPTDETRLELETNDARGSNIASRSELTDELVVPVVKEELEVRKEIHKTGAVRIRKTVRELEEIVNESLASETVNVERVPVDRIVDSLPAVRIEGEVTVIPVVREELVITKQLRVVEELRVTKRVSVSEYREPVTLRAEEVVIERVSSEDSKIKTNKAQG